MKKAFFIFALIFAFSVFTEAQTTAFNFQGRLNDGSNPANGRYDLQFILYDALVGGNQVGPIVQKPNTVLINGVFSTQLDFGAAAFTGGNRFLEIQLRPTGTANAAPNAYVILGARQQLLSVPYSVRSLNATNADNAQNAAFAQNAQNAQNATNAQTAVSAQNIGNIPASRVVASDSNGNVSFTNGDVTVNGKLTVNGSFVPPANSFGFVKAMAAVTSDGLVERCFNSTLTGTAATTVPCGITVNHFTLGGYGMNFGFPMNNRFVSLTIKMGEYFAPTIRNGMIRYENGSNGNIDVRTAKPGDYETTSDYPFMIIVY